MPERALLLSELLLDGSLSLATISTKTLATHLVSVYHEALTAILRNGQQ